MFFLTIAAIAFAVLLVKLFDRLRALERLVENLEGRIGEAGGVVMAPEPEPEPEPAPVPATAPPPEPLPARARAMGVARIVRTAAPPSPPPPPDPAPIDAPAEPADEKVPAFMGSFENLVGGKLLIWIGGAALVLTAFFLVRYSIENGLLGPGVRVILGALFGLLLLGGSEAARRIPATAADPRVAQALAGAGIASLYGTLYMAAELYGFVGALTAFVLMIAITVAALALSLRHGPPTAIMGLVGGFTAPLVTGLDPSSVAPLLVYLALFTAGLFALAIHRGWLWLALAATGGGLLWPLGLMAFADASALRWVGFFIVTLAFAATLALPRAGAASPLLRLAPLVTGLLQLVFLAPQLSFSPLAWGMYGLLAAAAIWLGWRDPRLSAGAAAALGLASALLAVALWNGEHVNAPLAAIGFTLLFGSAGHALARRAPDGRLWACIALGGTAAPLLLVYMLTQYLVPLAWWAVFWVTAALPCAWLSWRHRDEARAEPRYTPGLTGAAAVAALLIACESEWLAPYWSCALLIAIPVAIAGWARRTGDGGLFRLALVPLPVAALAWIGIPHAWDDYIESVFAGGTIPPLETLIAAGLLPTLLLAALAWLQAGRRAQAPVHWAAWLSGLAFALAIVPAPWHAPALALIAVAACLNPRPALIPAHGPLAAIAATFAAMLPQLLPMAGLVARALGGDTLPFTYLPAIANLLREAALPAALLAAMAWFRPDALPQRFRLPIAASLALPLVATLYALAKQPLGIDTADRFIALGFLERALITQALFALGLAALISLPRLRPIAIGLFALATFRLAWFDLLLLNPVAVRQAVGDWPILNLATAHAALAALWFWLAAPHIRPERLLRGAALAMTIVALCATVRQFVQGSLLDAPGIPTTENYLYSAALLVLALIWLWRGIMKEARDLRLVGLVLLTLVTLKVFLVDAGALEGILRILSFLGLGLALIAIGWAYGRFLGRTAAKSA